LGVCATDIILSEELNAFLRNLKISETGIAFILEPSGAIIASSTSEPITSGSGENTKLLAAQDSANPLIQKATAYLTETYQSLEGVTSDQKMFYLEGGRQYLEVVRFEDKYGLDWIVVLVVPEADFMEQIHRNTQITVLFCLLALLLTIMIGFLITQWLTRPLIELNATAQDIAKGEWNKTVALDRGDVIGDLARSLSTMAQQLKESFSTLEQRIEERTTELIQLNRELQKQAQIDGLTQVANRRYFDHYLAQEWQKLSLKKQPLALLLCDVDYFKLYNDTYGHQAGDRCLQKIAQVLTDSVHAASDLVARYGGEEFVIILSNTDQEGALVVAKRIFQLLSDLEIPHRTSDKHCVTLSMGIAAIYPTSSSSPRALVMATDLALYTAKAQGRGCFRLAPGPLLPTPKA
jgi:diguanylate cyclase (GGDEF)-like protein